MELSMVGAHIVERTEQHNNEIVNALLKEFDDGTKNCQDIGNVIYKVHK